MEALSLNTYTFHKSMGCGADWRQSPIRDHSVIFSLPVRIVAAQGASPRLLQKFFVLFGTCTIWHLFNCVIPAANMPLDQ